MARRGFEFIAEVPGFADAFIQARSGEGENIRAHVVEKGMVAQDFAGVPQQPARLDVVPVGYDVAERLPVRLEVEITSGFERRIVSAVWPSR